MGLERRGPQTVVAARGGVTKAAIAPKQARVVRSSVSTEVVSDPAVLARLLREIHGELDRILTDSASVISGAIFMQDVALVPGTNYVKHRLERTPMGVLVTLSTGAVLRVALPSTLDPKVYLGVTTVAAQTVSFLVF